MKILCFLLLMILASTEMVSYASASTTMGSWSCKQWTDRQNKLADTDAYTIWFQGYLSGANAMYDELLGRDFLKGAEKISIVDWTDIYCQKYPKSMLHDSANALIKKLQNDGLQPNKF